MCEKCNNDIFCFCGQNVQKPDEVSESKFNDLLSLIDEAEKVCQEKRIVLIDLQHDYLKNVGFTIDRAQGGFLGDLVYRRDDEIFIDVDHAMEYAID